MSQTVYFVSDTHLGSRIHPDPTALERKFTAWLESIAPMAKAVYFMGDIFDYWFEYKYVVPKGYVRFLGKCAELSDAGIELHFFAGNHDLWMRDYFQTELNAVIHDRAVTIDIMGKRFRLSHGDEDYRDRCRINDLLYRLYRAPLCRKLYAAVHPRWTMSLAEALSLASRRRGERIKNKTRFPHVVHNDYFDLEQEWLVRKAKSYAAEMPQTDYFLFGHRHLLLDLALPDEKRVLILGDWIKHMSWAQWDGQNLTLESMP